MLAACEIEGNSAADVLIAKMTGIIESCARIQTDPATDPLACEIVKTTGELQVGPLISSPAWHVTTDR